MELNSHQTCTALSLASCLLSLLCLLPVSAVVAQPGFFGPPEPPPIFDDWDDWSYNNTDPDFFTLSSNPETLRVTGDRGWVQSARQYENFSLKGEFRFLEPDSDSGIFLRVEPGTDFIFGWPGDAYQVQIREISVNDTDRPLPLLNLYRHVVAEGRTRYDRESVFDLYTGVGEWQQFEIILKDNFLTASLNGETVLRATDLENSVGYIGFQSEKGIVEYRNLEIESR